ncbi:hypothetical protein, partial [Pseudenhygromyxa sp. WMMC2535]|uniref:hypothetical protein n=1 Tax=Pseudenhygromyxa sp. WMMC2535 TaxID=2712867 RepID=UPI001C3C295F
MARRSTSLSSCASSSRGSSAAGAGARAGCRRLAALNRRRGAAGAHHRLGHAPKHLGPGRAAGEGQLRRLGH